jgi:hypothetical protein
MKYEALPLTTRSGVRIGGSYTPPPRDYNSREDVYWQGILLNIEPTFSERKVLGWTAYILFLIAVFALLGRFA